METITNVNIIVKVTLLSEVSGWITLYLSITASWTMSDFVKSAKTWRSVWHSECGPSSLCLEWMNESECCGLIYCWLLFPRWASLPVSLLWQSVQQKRWPENAHPHTHPCKCPPPLCALHLLCLTFLRWWVQGFTVNSVHITGSELLCLLLFSTISMFNLRSNEITEITGSRLISIFLWLTFNQIVFRKKKKKKLGNNRGVKNFWFVADNRRPRRSPGAAVRRFGISNLKSTSSRSRGSGGEVGMGLGLDWAGLRSQRVVRKKKWLWDAAVCINHKPLKRDVMTDSHAPQSQLKLWLIFVLFYLLWCISFFSFLFFSCPLLPRLLKQCRLGPVTPPCMHTGVMLLQCAWLMQHRAVWPSAWMDWNIQMRMHFPQ